jgi:hypothetical protein
MLSSRLRHGGARADDHVGRAGNAALALGLLGTHRILVWYLPGPLDAASHPATLASLTPGWVTPAALLLVVVTVAAAIWRGRRFGPLVVEDLPVEVPAEETMLGRAQLYRRSADRLHALDALRLGALHRIGATAGLPPAATLNQLIATAAALTGRPIAELRDLLVAARPRSDADLTSAAAALSELERAVRDAVIGAGPPARPHSSRGRS